MLTVENKRVECKNCGSGFETPKTRGSYYSFCEPCRPIRKKAWKRRTSQRYAKKRNLLKKHVYNNDPEKRLVMLRTQQKNWRKTVYGLTIEAYEAMLTAQGSVCAICLRVNMGKRSLSVDHDHKTGKIRALLCTKCNLGMGMFDDDAKILERVIKYLNKHRETE